MTKQNVFDIINDYDVRLNLTIYVASAEDQS